MSLVAWYPLIDGSLENKGLDTTPLTLHGTVPFTNGRVRTAPTFSANASNYYTMPPITKVNDFSICCWVKISADVSVSNWIVWQGVVSNNNRFGFVYLGGANSIGFRMGSFYRNSTIEKGKWYHLCMTMNDTNTVVFYINGIAVGTGVYEGYSFTENEVLYLGKSKDTSEPLNGQLQDFRYYDHCLSPKEVKEIAKGLCLHLPLKGANARPNLFKNSATMFNTFGLYPQSNPPVTSRELVFDENAPCGINGKILRYNIECTSSDQAWAVGEFFTPSLGSNFLPELTIGNTYCVSYWARCSIDNKVTGVQNFVSGTLIKSSDLKLTSEWKRYYQIFIATSTGVSNTFYVSKINVGDKGVFEVCCPKLELLSPTPYIPNVNDTQYSDYVLDYEPDCSGNEFDATKYGGLTTSDSNGRYNTAVAFNGTNTYLQGLAPTNSECKEFTIATWVKLNNNNTLNPAIYNCRTVSRHGINLIYRGNSSPTGILLDDGIANDVFPNSTLEPDKWYHIAVTRDTNTRKLYINGSFVSSGATTGNLADMSTKYAIGNIVTGTSIDSNYLNGSLSDFRLYTSVLSADDVKELYETSVSIAHNPPSLTESAYYNYVEGQKHSTFDKSKFTVVGSPTITDDGIASGFTISNYISIDDYIANKDRFKIEMEFKTSDGSQATGSGFTGVIASKSIRGLEIVYNDIGKKLQLLLSSDGSSWDISSSKTISNVPLSTLIKCSIEKTDTQYIFRAINLQTNTLIDTITINSTQKITATQNIMYIGVARDLIAREKFLGSIDLKQFSITVDGKEVFSGNKTGLDVIKPDNYTVVGSPVISEDGVASGFKFSPETDLKSNIDFSNINSFVIEGRYYNTTVSGLNQAVFELYDTVNNITKMRFGVQANGTTSTFYYPNSDTTVTNNQTFKTITLNTWNDFKIVYDGTNVSVYINDMATPVFSVAVTKSWYQHPMQLWIGLGSNQQAWNGSIDLNSFKIYVDGNLVYQPCLKIPYTESKTGSKIVDVAYRDRVKDVYDQHYLERYYTANETTQTVYEYPLFRDSMHSYEFDEGFDQSIKKVGVMISPEFTETTDVNMVKGNTKTTKLIEV